MKTTRLIAWVLCAATLTVAANGQRPPLGRQGFNRPADARDLRGGQPLSEEQWQQVLPWAQEHCQYRLAFIEKMGSDAQRERARRLIYNRYRQIMNIQFADVRQVVERQVKVQDEVFGAQIALRVSRGANNSQQEEKAKAALKAAVKELVQVQIEDKKVRIERLTAELKRLTKDPDQLAEQWYQNKLEQVYGRAPGNPDRQPTESASPDDSQSSDGR